MNSTNFPGTEVMALTRPGNFDESVKVFTAPAHTYLTPNTTYTVRLSGSSFHPGTTTNDGEDSGAATGFSIANEYDYFESSIWQRTGSGKSLRIAINGENTINTPATASIAISGKARVGQTLTSATSELVDPNGLPANASDYSFQWIRIDGTTETPISGATSNSYTLVAADAGKRVQVRVSFTDGLGFAEMIDSAEITIRAMMPPATCPAYSTPTGQTQVWRGTVTVAALQFGSVTFAHGYSLAAGQGSLSNPKSFDLGTSYTVDGVGVVASGRAGAGSLSFGLDSRLTSSEVRNLQLHVCGETYAFADAEYVSADHTYDWPRAGLDWSSLVGSTRGLVLTRPNTAAPRFTPSNNGRYHCFMEENPRPGSFVCRTYSGTVTPGGENIEYVSVWAYSATDPEGDTLTYSLKGPDASKFNINPTNGSVTTKAGVAYDFESQGSCIFEGRTHKKCMKVILKATDPAGLSATQEAIVTLEPGFEIVSLNVGTGLRDGYAVNPKVDLRWDAPWDGAGLQTRKSYEVQYYDTTSADFWRRKYNVDKNTDRTSLTRFMQFGRDYMVRVVAKDEDNLNIDETPWRPFTTKGLRDRLSIADAQARESTDTSLVFIVSLKDWASQEVTFTYATSDGTATAGSDYHARSRTETFAVGEKTKMITVPIINDSEEDSGETVKMTLTNVTGATLIDGNAIGTIYNTEQEITGNGLSAAFQNLPTEHTGEDDTFDVQILFDAPLSGSWTSVRDAITVLHGAHTKAHRVDGRSDLWNIGVEATSDTDVIVNLRESVPCEERGALCSSDGRRFEVAIATVIDGPDEDEEEEEVEETPATPLTGSLAGVPYSHDGETAFRFRVRFSEELASNYSYRTMRDSSVRVMQGTTSIGASGARRMQQGRNDHWEITITPQSDDAIAISFVTTTDCTATGAMCTEGAVPLSSDLSTTVKGPPGMTVANATAVEATGAMLHFDITLEHGAARHVTVEYATSDGSAIAGSDYTAKSGTLVVGAGEILKRISVPVLNDSLDEDSESMTLTLTNPSTGATLADSTATGTITNDDPMPRAWLTRFGRTIASQAVDAISDRINGKGRSHVQVGGITLNGETQVVEEKLEPGLGLEQVEWPSREADLQSMSANDLVLGSRFQLSSGPENGTGPTWTAWGHFATGGFEAEVDDTELDGRVRSGFLGADVSNHQWLGGMALSMSTGDGDFSLMTDEDSGEVESTLTSVYPYGKVALTDKVDLWGMVGAGQGDVTLVQFADTHRPEDQSISTDIDMRMGAIGVRGEVLSPEEADGVSIAVKTDAFLVKMTSDAVKSSRGNLAASKSDASRVRLALEGSKTWEAGAGRLTPSIEIGVRHDGGDAETGTGIEIGGGLRYEGAGVSIEGAVRSLIAHEESGYEEWGASGAIRIDPGTSGRGLALRLAPSWGNASSGMDQIWSPRDAHGLSDEQEFEAKSRVEGEIGYGLTVRTIPGVVTPYAGMTLGNSDGRAWRTGARWQMGTHAALGIEANTAGEDTGVTLRARLRF